MTRCRTILVLHIALALTLAIFKPCLAKTAVFVSILPQKYFVQRIGGDFVDVQVMVQPGASPATYEPNPGQMTAIAGASVYFAIGVPFENVWLERIAASNPNMKIVHTDHGIKKKVMPAHFHGPDAPDEAGGPPEGEHEQNHHYNHIASPDPHIWLSPYLVSIQAHAILTALQSIDPTHRADYEANHAAFISEIRTLDVELRTIFSGKQGLQFMVFHPAWGYFADAYGLKQIPVEIQGKNPKPAQLMELIKFARKSDIRVIFVQPQFSAKSAEVIAESIDGRVVIADPLAENWASNLRKVAHEIEAALRK